MVTIFWNVNGRDLRAFVAALARDNDADLLILAENEVPAALVLEGLNEPEVRWQFASTPGVSNMQFFVRGGQNFVEALYDLPRMSIRRVMFPGWEPYILAAVHLSSGMWRNEDDQVSSSRDLVETLKSVEEEAGHTRSIVIGDFNMNPFSKSLVFADSWNAVRTYDVAESLGRIVDNKAYSYFYNPMWQLLQDGRTAPAGTFFYQPSGYASVHWHLLDQVLLRPAMLQHFGEEGVSILDECSEGSLAQQNGRPSISDHFPVLLRLNL